MEEKLINLIHCINKCVTHYLFTIDDPMDHFRKLVSKIDEPISCKKSIRQWVNDNEVIVILTVLELLKMTPLCIDDNLSVILTRRAKLEDELSVCICKDNKGNCFRTNENGYLKSRYSKCGCVLHKCYSCSEYHPEWYLACYSGTCSTCALKKIKD